MGTGSQCWKLTFRLQGSGLVQMLFSSLNLVLGLGSGRNMLLCKVGGKQDSWAGDWCECVPCWHWESGSKRKPAVCNDYVPALCTHHLSLLPTVWFCVESKSPLQLPGIRGEKGEKFSWTCHLEDVKVREVLLYFVVAARSILSIFVLQLH